MDRQQLIAYLDRISLSEEPVRDIAGIGMMQRAHLEWLFRMMQEPGRLAKRYIVGNARFMALLRREKKRLKEASR